MIPGPRLLGLATAVPPYVLAQEAVADHAYALFPEGGTALVDRMMGVYDNAGIETRYSCVEMGWYERERGWAEKNDLYLTHATRLIEQATLTCLDRAGLGIEDIDTIVAVSTTGIATPSLDARLMERLAMRRDIRRLPIFGLGCAGGVLGLARAAAMASADPGSRVLLVVVELCGLTFRRADQSKSNVIATALFGDGAAAAILSTDGDGLAIGPSGEHTWPSSLDIMGWSVEADGLGVIFSRDIPSLTRTEFRDAAKAFLARHGLDFGSIDRFLCHPGGAKVLDALEDAFDLPPGGLALSRNVLRHYGNMSAATVLFVLDEALRAHQRGRFLLSSLGPGFTAAFLLAEAT